jgi:hypothetical protein
MKIELTIELGSRQSCCFALIIAVNMQCEMLFLGRTVFIHQGKFGKLYRGTLG